MRLTTASVAATVLIAAGIFTFWPGTSAGPGAATSVAQTQEPQTKADPTDKEKPAEIQKAAAIKDVLERRTAIEFSEVPLRDVARRLSDQNGITIALDAKGLEDAGINLDTPVTQTFRDVRLRTFLDLMLGQLEMAYYVTDNVLVFTTPEQRDSRRLVRVYDCRELLSMERPRGSVLPKVTRGGMAGGGFFAVQDEPVEKTRPATDSGDGAATPPATEAAAPEAQNVPSGGQGIGNGRSGEGNANAAGTEMSDVENLIQFITTIVAPETWTEVGGPCSIAEYKGLIAVASTEDVHGEIERLLNMLHEAANLKAVKVTVLE